MESLFWYLFCLGLNYVTAGVIHAYSPTWDLWNTFVFMCALDGVYSRAKFMGKK